MTNGVAVLSPNRGILGRRPGLAGRPGRYPHLVNSERFPNGVHTRRQLGNFLTFS